MKNDCDRQSELPAPALTPSTFIKVDILIIMFPHVA